MVVSICITLCVCCFYLFFFEKGWIWRDDNKKYCIIFKKKIYIYTNFKGCQVDGKGCHSRLQTSPLFGGSSLTPALPQGYTMSLGMKKTKAQYALPHPYLGAYVIMCWVIRWFGANDCLSSKYGVRWVVSNSNIQGCWNIPFVSYCFTVLFILLMFNDVHGMFSKSVSLGIKPSTRWRTHMKQRFNEPQLCAMGPTRTDWSCNML